MKGECFGKRIALLVGFIILFSLSSFAGETQVVTIRGSVMGLDLTGKLIVVNEKIFTWDGHSIFYDEKGLPVPITEDRLKDGTWVLIEATRGKNKPYLIKTISLIKK